VLKYRLAAFHGIAVVGGLMLKNSMDTVFKMEKAMTINPLKWDGFIQLLSFTLLTFVLFANVLSIYIGVAQPYHTIRLMTAGPTGYEIAASYYLNKNVVAYRHLAIKTMLVSLPVFLVSSGLRLMGLFDNEYQGDKEDALHPSCNPKGKSDPCTPADVPWEARLQGILFFLLFTIVALTLYYIHRVHFSVFRDRYAALMTATAFTVHTQGMTQQRVITSARTEFIVGPNSLDV